MNYGLEKKIHNWIWFAYTVCEWPRHTVASRFLLWNYLFTWDHWVIGCGVFFSCFSSSFSLRLLFWFTIFEFYKFYFSFLCFTFVRFWNLLCVRDANTSFARAVENMRPSRIEAVYKLNAVNNVGLHCDDVAAHNFSLTVRIQLSENFACFSLLLWRRWGGLRGAHWRLRKVSFFWRRLSAATAAATRLHSTQKRHRRLYTRFLSWNLFDALVRWRA